MSYCTKLIEIKNIENLYTDECTNVASMFDQCISLKEINLKYFETSNVENMKYMFFGCSSLKYLDLSSFRFLYKGIIINHNKKPSQPTLKRRFFQEKGGVFSWPGFGKEWC